MRNKNIASVNQVIRREVFAKDIDSLEATLTILTGGSKFAV